MNNMGIGIDIVQISRIKNPDLLAKGILTDKELEIYHQKGINKIQFLAGRYAGKEAFMKAIEKGIDQTSFKQIEILYKSSGAPLLTYQNHEYEISISHDGDYAVAIVKL